MGQVTAGAQPGQAGQGGQSGEQAEPTELAAPTLSLPKGGGAISGMGEKFSTNPVTGTGRMTFPVYSSRGRSGFGPQLSIDYDSANGNGPFGFGWKLGLQSVSRKTSLGLPRYDDAHDSDVFLLSGAEDLMPALVPDEETWTFDVTGRALYGNQYEVRRYRPRVEGLFARIERWTNVAEASDVFWRSISRENVITWYGLDGTSRIADPADASRIFEWLVSTSYDDKGNVVAYEYKAENSDGIDLTQANEHNRTDATRSAQRYLASISYGNRTPYLPDLTSPSAAPLPTDWCFQLVFDYGEYDFDTPLPEQDSQPWACRADSFSTYRSTFEVRTYRLCRRVLMFHQFPEEQDVGANCLVHSTDFAHATSPPADPSQPFYSYLLSAFQSGYARDGAGGYVSASVPPVQFTYSEALIDETVRDVDPGSLANLPRGLDTKQYCWVDLDGEGLSGILTEQGGGWFYKANLSPANVQHSVDGTLTLPTFAPVQAVQRVPATADLAGGKQLLLALSGDGFLSLVQFDAPVPGYFERTPEADWEPFTAFASMPVVDWSEPNLRFIDLTGDGFADVLISGDNALWWHNSLSTEGFGPGQRVAQAVDEENGPRLLFADGTESIFLADMSGDGLTDLVRARVAEVCYWPNLGYGRFGTKVTMDGVPRFDRAELFDSRRIRLADIDGSGTADVIYLADSEVHLYFSQSGNGLAARRVLANFASVDSASTVEVLDLLGKGTACLVWSSPLAGDASAPMRYIDLMAGGKPHLLVGVANNLAAETHVQYAPSTKFYVLDKMAGKPWITRLPFPVHVVECVETLDFVSRNRFVTRYSYHHGYYDGVEREFRGFGRVDQWDAGELATLGGSSSMPAPTNEAAASNIPPVLTKQWFHTGYFFAASSISTEMQAEYWLEGDTLNGASTGPAQALLLGDSAMPTTVLLADGIRVAHDLSGEEMREACRALRGSPLRQEVYAADDTPAAGRPYTTTEYNYTIEMLQPEGENPYAVFLTHPREKLDFHYERAAFTVVNGTLADPAAPPPGAVSAADPRVTHSLVIDADAFGDVLASVTASYPRRVADPSLSETDQASQATLLCTATESSYTNPITSADANRTPMPAQKSVYQLLQCTPAAATPGETNRFGFDELAGYLTAAGDGEHDLPFEDLAPSGLTPGQPYRRLLSCSRTLYRPDDLGQAAGSTEALLPLGTLQSLALPGVGYRQSLTASLVTSVFERASSPLLPTPSSVLGSIAADGGGYIDLDSDGNWWIASTRVFFAATTGTPAQELATARAGFFLPRRHVDAFGGVTTVTFDPPHNLLVTQTKDAVGNLVSATNDYRVLAPALVTNENGNQAAARFDALGMVAGTAVMGKPGQNLGDSFATFTADLTQAEIDSFYAAADPHMLAGALLGTASTRIVYNLQQYLATSQASPADPSAWQPIFAATLTRETHMSDLPPGQPSAVQISFSYSDGFGREIQKKLQAEPGTVSPAGPVVDPRWIGSGWTIFNNKGKPVRQYEPFFSGLAARGHQFEFGVQVGVSPILCYDPLERVVATVHPNHSYEKVVFDPWHQASWDMNDTVLIADPAADPDVGALLARLVPTDYSPTWYQQRSSGTLGPQEQTAASKAAAHADTPTTAYFDPFGRSVLTVLDNGAAGKYPTRLNLDVQGYQRSVTDALSRQVMAYDYDMLGTRIHSSSMEAGQRWALNDVMGKPIQSWDDRGHNQRTAYDALRRPTELYVLGTDAANSDPRTLAGELCYEKTVYGEGQPGAEALNLNTRVFQRSDPSGTGVNMAVNPVTNEEEAFDFKGNLLRSSRQLVTDPKALTDWSGPAPSLMTAWTSSTTFDALNRPVTMTSVDGSVTTPTYNERNALQAVSVTLAGAATATNYVTDIEYDAKGQRLQITFSSAGTTAYSYDPLTFRLTSLTTTRPAYPANQQSLQDLAYTYDPVGNLTHIQDDADLQNIVFFRNRRVEPSNDYTYDPVYRLIEATGREQLGLATGGAALAPAPTSYNDTPRKGLILPGDGKAMGTYDEQYQYDPVGNLLKFVHGGSAPANPGWSRTYSYNEASLLDPAQMSNRLTSSVVAGNQPLTEPCAYDRQGNLTAMPQLHVMQWDFLGQLAMTQRQAVGASDADGELHQGEQTFYVYDAGGNRIRKVTYSSKAVLTKERLYLGGCEVYREYAVNGTVTLERQTLHVMDDKRRIAIVETTTIDASAAWGSLPSVTTRYQFANHLGTATLELDANAAVISYEEYYPYGCTSYQAGRTVTEVSLKRYRYTAKERDEETGLYYYGARYYAPWLARWTSPEPLGIKNGPNLYSYAGNQPVNRVDTDGRDFWDFAKGLAIGVGVALAVVAVVVVTVAFFPVVGTVLAASAPFLLAAGAVATAETVANWAGSRSSNDPAVRGRADKELGMSLGGWLVAGASGPIAGGMARAGAALDEAAAGLTPLQPAFKARAGRSPLRLLRRQQQRVR